MRRALYHGLSTVPHAGYLGEQDQIPPYVHPESGTSTAWPYYEAGIYGSINVEHQMMASEVWDFTPGLFTLRCYYLGQFVERRAKLGRDGLFRIYGSGLDCFP